MTIVSSPQQYVLFTQGQSAFAIELKAVREVLKLSAQTITPVPNTLTFVLGLTNLRGEIITVTDFGCFIGEEAVKRQDEEARILVVELPHPQDVQLPRIRMGIAVAQVEGVQSLHPEQIVSHLEVGEALVPILRGLYDHHHRLLMILESEAIAQKFLSNT
ncbi:chemotaxis protein CheW [Spirulina subsalsa]|uniref:chemotaxis protein CheW n=1 Tax=Spirulina subsalsa TaxID=54311 RepID=UPI0002E97029|nr:chemotaxis protein CheW [Spirulina subsalsa]